MRKALCFLSVLAAIAWLPRTVQAQISLPYTMDFEEETAFNAWTIVNGATGWYSTERVTQNAHNGSAAFRFAYSYNPPQYLISPEFEEFSGPVQVKFWYKVESDDFDESFAVGHSSTTSDASSFTWLDEQTNLTNTSYAEYECMVPAGTKYIAIKYTANDQYALYIDDIVVQDPPTCLPVTDLAASEITGSGFTLTWADEINSSASYTVSYWPLSSPADITTQSEATSPYTVSGLNASTGYGYSVTANCSDDDSSLPASGTVATGCEGGSCNITVQMADSYGDGWNGTSQINFVQNGVAVGSAKLSSGNSGTATVSVCSGMPVSFSWQSGSYDSEDSYVIYDGGGGEVYSSATGGVDHTGTIETPCPSCIPVGNLAASFVTSSGATFSWLANSDESLWAVYIDGVERSDSPVSSTTYVVDDLGASTNYTFSVRAICVPGEDTSAVSSVSFQTECDGYAPVPFQSGFEDLQTGEFPNCWVPVQTGSSGVGTIFPSAYRWQNNAHNSQVYFEFESSHQETEILALPRMENISQLQLSFWASSTSNTNGFVLEAGVVEEDEEGNYTFVPVDTISLYSGPAESWSSSYRIYNVLFNTYEGDGERLGLRTTPTGTNMYTLMIDDFSVINAGVPVLGPFAGTFAAEVGVDLTVGAPALMTGSDVSYEWQSFMVSNGDASFTGDINQDTVTLNYTAAGIDSLWVIASNAAGADTALALVYVVDLSPVSTFPYTTGFEEGDDCSWLTGNAINGWYIGTATARTGERSLYVSSDNGTTNDYGATTVRSYAFRHLEFDAAGEYTLSFDWKGMGNSSSYMRAYLAPGNVEPSANSYTGSSWTALGGSHYGFTAWQTEESLFSVDSGSYTLIFCWANNSTINNPAAAVDNVSIVPVTCPAVHDLSAEPFAHSANLSWTPVGEEAAWWVVLDDGEGYEVNSTSIVLDNLQPESSHTVSVRAVCGEGDSSHASIVSFATTIACPAVTGLHLSEVSQTSATVVWTAGGSETEWQVSVDGGTPATVNAATYQITGLTASTQHTVSVTANCGDEDGVSTVATLNFNTACDVVTTLPWSDDFTAATVGEMPLCWDMGYTGSDASSSPRVAASSTYIYGMSNFLFLKAGDASAYGNDVYVVLPEFSTGLGELTLTFDYVYEDEGSGLLSVGYVTGADYAADYVEVQPVSPNSSVTSLSVSFSNAPAEASRIALRWSYVSTSWYSVGIDNVVVSLSGSEPPVNPCDAPVVTGTTATPTTVTMTYTGQASSYEVAIVQGSWVAPASGTATTQGSHTFSGLTPETQYTVGVRAVCGNDHSGWATASVTTGTEPVTDECPIPTGVAAEATGRTVSVSWTDNGASAYKVAYFMQGLAEGDTVTATTNHATIGNLEGGNGYDLYVYTVCQDGSWSEPSSKVSVSIAGIDGIDGSQLRLYPNPAATTVALEGLGGEAEVMVVDMNGRTVLQAVASGSLTLDVSGLAQGAYFVRVTGECYSAIRKLVVR